MAGEESSSGSGIFLLGVNRLHFDGKEQGFQRPVKGVRPITQRDLCLKCKAHNIEFTSSGLFPLDHRGHVQEKKGGLCFTRAVERLLL